MADLKTRYLGIELKNPVIVGACNLADNPENLKRAEAAGAAAIVYKSLFEEQIHLENAQLDNKLNEYSERYAEMITLFPKIEHAGPEEHLFNLAKAKRAVKIPVIASLNAVFKESWVEYARRIQETGVDALEINFYAVPRDIFTEGPSIVKDQLDILNSVKKAVTIPVAVKLSPFYANPLNVIKSLDDAGADGFVLFNRLFQPDIDIDKETHLTPFNLSVPDDNRLPLRFAGLLYGNVKGGICSNTGIFTGKDVVKMILAGADCVQVVSTVYRNKIDYISTIVKDVETWMEKKGYHSLDGFRGKLSNKSINNPFIYKRAQYIDLLLKSDEVLDSYPVS